MGAGLPKAMPPSLMKMGEGRDGGVFAIGIAPIPAFPRCRGKEQIGGHDAESQ